MSYRPLVTRKEEGQRVAYLEQNDEYVPRGTHIKRIRVLTQAQYDAIIGKDDYTLYLIRT